MISATKNFTSQTRSSMGANLDYSKLQYTTLTLSTSTRSDAESCLEEIVQQPGILYVTPYVMLETGEEICLTNCFYVQLKNEADFYLLQKMAAEVGVDILSQNLMDPLLYTLSCHKQSKGDAVEMANQFHESGLFDFCEPDMIMFKPDSPNDPRYSRQWNLKNIGQAGGVSGIDINYEMAIELMNNSQLPNSIAAIQIIDEGVKTHEDLYIESLHSHFDMMSNSVAEVIYGSHGTNCAGILMGIANNSKGIASLANNRLSYKSLSVDFTSPRSTECLANAIRRTSQVSGGVVSCSWGSSKGSSTINDAIYAATTARRGQVLMVFSSGNNNTSISQEPAASNPQVIVVGAINQWGKRKSPTSQDGDTRWGSNYGKRIDVVAPGVDIYTTDLNNSYMSNFGGTSAACPHVAILAATLKSIPPYPSNEEIKMIIEKTARKVGGYNYKTTSGRTNGTWNEEVGYGLIDAHAAIKYCIDRRDSGGSGGGRRPTATSN